jgi:hypothetical protein
MEGTLPLDLLKGWGQTFLQCAWPTLGPKKSPKVHQKRLTPPWPLAGYGPDAY